MHAIPDDMPHTLAARLVGIWLACLERLLRLTEPQANGEKTMNRRGITPGDAFLDSQSTPITAGSAKHPGKHPSTEDRLRIRCDLGLVVVAHAPFHRAGGDVAAQICVEQVASAFTRESDRTAPLFSAGDLSEGLEVAMVRFGLRQAHLHIRRAAASSGPPGMVCMAAVLLFCASEATVGIVGDCHVHRLRRGALEPLVREAGRGLSQLGGAAADVKPIVRKEAWEQGDVYLVSTPALLQTVPIMAIREVLAGIAGEQAAAEKLVELALYAGATEGVTVVVARPVMPIEVEP